MIQRASLHVEVADGSFPHEKVVTFLAGAQKYSLFVDERDVNGRSIDVAVVAFNGDSVLIDLPSDTFTSGSRVWVPRTLLELDSVAA
ncbi:MAG TPA: hypothetical protein VFJ58_02720 [Armatimonadota bacterium]|nr:hypothetical protein [Armatimonadota bacterium]